MKYKITTLIEYEYVVEADDMAIAAQAVIDGDNEKVLSEREVCLKQITNIDVLVS